MFYAVDLVKDFQEDPNLSEQDREQLTKQRLDRALHLQQIDIHAYHRLGYSHFLRALHSNQMFTMGWLLESGSIFAQQISTDLLMAVESNDYYTTKWLLDNGARINKIDNKSLAALHVAINCRHYKIIDLLINYGAELNSRKLTEEDHNYYLNPDKPVFYSKPLINAIEIGELKIFKTLIFSGAKFGSKEQKLALSEFERRKRCNEDATDLENILANYPSFPQLGERALVVALQFNSVVNKKRSVKIAALSDDACKIINEFFVYTQIVMNKVEQIKQARSVNRPWF